MTLTEAIKNAQTRKAEVIKASKAKAKRETRNMVIANGNLGLTAELERKLGWR